MITKEFSEACTEISEIFKYLDKNEVNKIPENVRKMIDNNKSKDFIPNIDPHKSIEKQILKPETKDLLVALYVEYWCPENEKEYINKLLRENYIKEQESLRKKYNPDDIFKQKNKEISTENNQAMLIKYKESILKKIINKISKFFKNKK